MSFLQERRNVAQLGTKPRLEPDKQLPPGGLTLDDHSEARSPEILTVSLRVLWNKRRMLAKATVLGLLLGSILAFILPKEYTATTQLMPPDAQQSASALAMMTAMSGRTNGGVGAIAGDLLGLKTSGALFVGVLNSRTVQDRLVDRFDLRMVYGMRFQEDARRKLAERTSISEDRKSGIISVRVIDHDPKRAAALAQAYLEELDHLVSALSTSSARRERVFLEERLSAVKQELDKSAQEFSQFSSKNSAIDIKEQGRAMVDAAATLMGQLIAAESELKGLEQIYTPNNVRMRSVQARITELRTQLEKMGGKGEGSTELSDGSGTNDSLYPSIRKLPLLGVKYADLYRQTKIQEVVFETLTQEYELAKVQEAKEIPSVKVLDIATIPEKKTFPPRLFIVSFCAALTLVGAIAFCLGESRWKALDAHDPNKIFAQEIFQSMNAYMPWATPNGSRIQALTNRAWVKFVSKGEQRPERQS